MSLFSYLYKLLNHKKIKESLPGVWRFFRCSYTRETPQCICQKGSLTVEAAVILPLFAGFFSFLLFYFQIMNVELIVQNALEETGRKLAILAVQELEEPETENHYLLLAKGMLLAELKEEERIGQYVKGGAAGVSLLTSQFETEMIVLNARYCMHFPIRFFGIQDFLVSQKSLFRKWNGWKNKEERGAADTLVYVTEYGTVFHMKRSCPYLELSIQKIDYEQLKEKKNANGETYKACERCAGKQSFSGNIYITNYGKKYHYDLNCQGLKRRIYQKRLSETGGMAACQKCSK